MPQFIQTYQFQRHLVSDLECGDPATISHGGFRLLNGTHRFGSVVRYECDAGHLLAGSVGFGLIH